MIPSSFTVVTLPADGAGVATFPLAVPADPVLVGIPFYLRGVAVGLGEPFLGLASLSDVVEVLVGG